MNKKVFRAVKALFIRFVFLIYGLICVWRVTIITENKLYWLIVISLALLFVEASILIWARAGKEFECFIPSVMLFLICILPSFWIINMDEVNRKVRFAELAKGQESKIKELMSSKFDLFESQNTTNLTSGLIQSNKNKTRTHNKNSSLPLPLEKITSNGNLFFIDNKSLTNFINSKQSVPRTYNDRFSMALSMARSQLNATITTTPATTTGLKETGKKLDKSIDCCQFDLTYWFKEDQYQQLFFQLLMLILIVSRWTITTDVQLNPTHRTFILILSVANALDTLDLATYINLELIYQNTQLTYSLLLIVSLSLVQFMFLPSVKDTSSNEDILSSNFFDEAVDDDDYDDEDKFRVNNYEDLILDRMRRLEERSSDPDVKKKELKFKLKNPRLSIFNRQYNLNSKKMEASEIIGQQQDQSPSAFFSYGNVLQPGFGKFDKNFKLPSQKELSRQLKSTNKLLYSKKNDKKALESVLCCCCCSSDQKSAQFFILLAEILINEVLYLIFRVFLITKLADFDSMISQKPMLLFFGLKNVIFILNQVYRLYGKRGGDESHSIKRNLSNRYNNFMLSQLNNYPTAASHSSQMMPHQSFFHNNPSKDNFNAKKVSNTNSYLNGGSFNFMRINNNGNKIQPAVPSSAICPSQMPVSQEFYLTEQTLVSPNQNPYRFAQVYHEPGMMNPNGHINKNPVAMNKPMPVGPYVPDNSNMYQYYSNNITDFQHRSSLSTLLSESLLELMDKENETKPTNSFTQQHPVKSNSQASLDGPYNGQKGMHITQHSSNKPGQRFFGLPFRSGNNSNSAVNNGTEMANLNSTSSSCLLRNGSSANLTKHVKAAKV